MSKTPEQYANELIRKYMLLKQKENFGWSGMGLQMAIQCAVIDVTNTIDYVETWGDTVDGDLEYFKEILIILKSKL